MLAGAAVVVAVAGAGAVVVMASAERGDPGRARAAGDHRDGGAGSALGHGLPVRDPDLPRAIGRLAVLGDQPGPRDVHRAARCRRHGRLRRRALPGGRQAGAAAVRLDAGVPVAVGGRQRARRRASSTPTWCDLGYATRAQLDPSSDRFGVRDGVRAREAAVRGWARLGPGRWSSVDAVFLPRAGADRRR